MKKNNLRALSMSAVLGAVGFVLMLLEFPLPFIIPSFIKFDFSELPCIIATFTFGPVWGILSCFIKNLIHLFITSTSGVGELSNFVLGAAFTGFCGIIYKYDRTRKGALISCLIGSLLMAGISVASNYYLVYPAYEKIFGMPMDVIVGMYKTILPASDSLIKSLIIFNMPFTFVKGIADSLICFAVYKRISPILRNGFGKKNKKERKK